MCPTSFALHVVAAFRLLNRASALWTISSIILLLPLCEGIVTDFGMLVLITRETLMTDGSTLSTYGRKTGGTGEYLAVIGHFVHLVAVGSRAVLLVTWMCPDVMHKRILQQFIKLISSQSSFEFSE